MDNDEAEPGRTPGETGLSDEGDLSSSGPSGVRMPEPDEHPGSVTASRDRSLLRDAAVMLLLVLVLGIIIKAFFLQAFYIPSQSMQPGLVQSDRIVVQKVSYWLGGSPQRGDVVVFEDPGDWLGPEEQPGPQNPITKALGVLGLYPSTGHLVKRVIGIPGDNVECCDVSGRILVNGKPLDESSYVETNGAPCNGPMTGNCAWVAGPVPAGTVFVLGDNRSASADSSVHLCTTMETDCTDVPYVDDSLIVGKVWGVVWPFSRFGVVDNGPSSFDDVPAPLDPAPGS